MDAAIGEFLFVDDNGNIVIQEYKSSKTAGFTENQGFAYDINKSISEFYFDGIIKNGKGKLANKKIPKGTKIRIIRPGDLI